MNKRSAMAIAAGLVAALLTGAVALSLGMTAPQTADASSDLQPRVRTVHRTIKVHREAKAEEPRTITIVPASSSTSNAAQGGDDGFEDDSFESEGSDDSFESEGSDSSSVSEGTTASDAGSEADD